MTRGAVIQGTATAAVWTLIVAWLSLPVSMVLFGVPFAYFLAWRDHREPEPLDEVVEDDEDEAWLMWV